MDYRFRAAAVQTMLMCPHHCLPSLQGAPGYCAPEVFSRTWHLHPTACDSYGIGIMVLEIITGHLPELFYRGLDPDAIRFLVSREEGGHRTCIGGIKRGGGAAAE